MSDKESSKSIHTLSLKGQKTPSTSIDEVVKEITDWRANKTHTSTSIPDRLWQKVFSLTTIHTGSKIRGLLGVSTKQYNRKYKQFFSAPKAEKVDEAQQGQAVPIELCQVKTPPSVQASPSASMYKPLKIPSSNTIIAEFCHADGRVMKIHSTSESFHALIQAFFQEVKNVSVNVQT